MDRKPNDKVGEVPFDQDQHPFLSILERDDVTCQLCGSQRDLQVHHVCFRSRGGDDSERNLLCLFRDCHAEVHAHRTPLGDENMRDRLAVSHLSGRIMPNKRRVLESNVPEERQWT